MTRTRHRAAVPITALQIVVPNFYVDNLGNEVATGLGTTTVVASIEYPAGTFTQIKFGGNTSGSVATGTFTLSDSMACNIPQNVFFWIRLFIQNATGVVSTFIGATSPATPILDTVNGEALTYAVSGLSDQTMGGTVIDTDGQGRYGFFPIAIIGRTTQPSILGLGDSRMVGQGDSYSDNTGDMGEIFRSLGPYFAYTNLGRGGHRAAWYLAQNSIRSQLAAYVSNIVCELGGADLRAGTSAAAVASTLQSIRALYPSKNFIQSTITPFTTSTDGWTTTANQTSDTGNAARVTLNDNIRAAPSWSPTYFEVADAVENGRNGLVWKAPSYTADGVHETNAAYIIIKNYGSVSPNLISTAPRYQGLDSDWDTDIDDIAALTILAGAGRVAVATACSSNVYAAPALDACVSRLGSIPVGAYMGGGLATTSDYDLPLRDRYRPGKTRSDYASAVTALRTALASAPNGRFALVITGPATNIAALLSSAADGISPLTGTQLIAAKCQGIYAQLGNFTSSTTSTYNAVQDVTAANYVVTNSPVPVYLCGDEVGVSISSRINISTAAVSNPVVEAWAFGSLQWNGSGGRSSWDPCTAYFALLGTTTGLFGISVKGAVTFSPTSPYTTFTVNPSGNVQYVTKSVSDATIQTAIQAAIDAGSPLFSQPIPYASITDARLAEWQMGEGTGTTVADSSGLSNTLTLGNSGSALPTWVDLGTNQWVLNFNGSQGAFCPSGNSGVSYPSMTLAALVNPTSITGTPNYISKVGQSYSFQFRNEAGQLRYTSGSAGAPVFGAGTLPVNAWKRVIIEVAGTRIRGYVNGVQVSADQAISYMTGATVQDRLGVGAMIPFGALQNGLTGQIGYAALFKIGTSIADIDARIASFATAKNIIVT